MYTLHLQNITQMHIQPMVRHTSLNASKLPLRLRQIIMRHSTAWSSSHSRLLGTEGLSRFFPCMEGLSRFFPFQRDIWSSSHSRFLGTEGLRGLSRFFPCRWDSWSSSHRWFLGILFFHVDLGDCLHRFSRNRWFANPSDFRQAIRHSLRFFRGRWYLCLGFAFYCCSLCPCRFWFLNRCILLRTLCWPL